MVPWARPNPVFQVLSGVVDTDVFAAPVNFPFFATAGDGVHVLPKGTPLVQVIPFRRADAAVSSSIESAPVRPETEGDKAVRQRIHRAISTGASWYRNNARAGTLRPENARPKTKSFSSNPHVRHTCVGHTFRVKAWRNVLAAVAVAAVGVVTYGVVVALDRPPSPSGRADPVGRSGAFVRVDIDVAEYRCRASADGGPVNLRVTGDSRPAHHGAVADGGRADPHAHPRRPRCRAMPHRQLSPRRRCPRRRDDDAAVGDDDRVGGGGDDDR